MKFVARFERGADVQWGLLEAETLEAAQRKAATYTHYDVTIEGPRQAPASPRPYDDHAAKVRAAEYMIDSMRPMGEVGEP